MNFDPRVTLLRDGVADDRLEGVLTAKRFVAARTGQVTSPVAALRAAPDARAEQLDQLLFGEAFERLESSEDFVLGQASRDGYVGWVEAAALSDAVVAPTHWVSALRAYAFEAPSIKAPARGPLSLNALVAIEEESETLARDARIGWIARTHLSPVGTALDDPAAIALAHLGAPYLWGGRDSLGIDCSGLVQQASYAAGRACPRDTDQQAARGASVAPADLCRGDLVFWWGHVGMMLDGERLLHANAHHMAVAIEPLAEAMARIAANGGGQPTAYRRV